MKRTFLLSLLILVALGVIGVLVFRSISRTGSNTIEGWIGQQLQLIANSYLKPALSFSDLDYEHPGTVSLKNFRLQADDPANPGQTIDILASDSALLTLAEIPTIGKPIVIERIVLNRPLISAVSENEGNSRLVGFSDLMKGSPADMLREQSATGPATRPVLSTYFQIRLIQIADGRIVYNPRIPDTSPMELDQIHTTLNVQPSETGWYQFDTNIARRPIFDLALSGQLNIDTFTARQITLNLAAAVNQENLNYLPPQLQQWLKKYEVAGSLNVRANGELPLMQPTQGRVDTDIKLTRANVTVGEYRIPIENLDLTTKLADHQLVIPTLKIAGLRGSMDGSGSLLLNENLDTNVRLKVTRMQLQDLLAARKEGEPVSLAGYFDASFTANAPLKAVLAEMKGSATPAPSTLPAQWGSGSIEVVDGRLVRIPIFHHLSDTVSRAMRIVTAGRSSNQLKERAKVVFGMHQDQVHVQDLTYVGELVAARGQGTVGLDQQLDLRVAAGPVERVQALLGERIGGAIAAVTDTLLSYRVTGKISEPKIEPVIGGGAVENVGQGIERLGRGVGNIGRGIGNILRPGDGQQQRDSQPQQ